MLLCHQKMWKVFFAKIRCLTYLFGNVRPTQMTYLKRCHWVPKSLLITVHSNAIWGHVMGNYCTCQYKSQHNKPMLGGSCVILIILSSWVCLIYLHWHWLCLRRIVLWRRPCLLSLSPWWRIEHTCFGLELTDKTLVFFGFSLFLCTDIIFLW
jgi:hypothetical protein